MKIRIPYPSKRQRIKIATTVTVLHRKTRKEKEGREKKEREEKEEKRRKETEEKEKKKEMEKQKENLTFTMDQILLKPVS